MYGDNKSFIDEEKENALIDSESVVSTTECTGLMQTPPESVAEAESYSRIYDVPHTKKKVNNLLQEERPTQNDTLKHK